VDFGNVSDIFSPADDGIYMRCKTRNPPPPPPPPAPPPSCIREAVGSVELAQSID